MLPTCHSPVGVFMPGQGEINMIRNIQLKDANVYHPYPGLVISSDIELCEQHIDKFLKAIISSSLPDKIADELAAVAMLSCKHQNVIIDLPETTYYILFKEDVILVLVFHGGIVSNRVYSYRGTEWVQCST